MRYWLVMPAAGAGTRFGGRQSGERIPKQYASLRGRTVIEWALAPFLADGRCSGAAVALAAGDTWWPKVAERIPAVTVCQGGAERSESVRNALLALNRRAGKEDWVLVHDAARPCLSSADLDRLLAQVDAHPVGGILALPVADTLKRAVRFDVLPSAAAPAAAVPATPAAASPGAAALKATPAEATAAAPAGWLASASPSVPAMGASKGAAASSQSAPAMGAPKGAAASKSAEASGAPAIEVTVDRAGLWRASTPQMFRFGLLLTALESALAAKRFPTDESQALEWQGHQPLLVEGSTANIKVTTAADLALAESLLAARESKSK
jgi:2-C-methyl-D-erythritol 4-phosphate cytidylyltransferase